MKLSLDRFIRVFCAASAAILLLALPVQSAEKEKEKEKKPPVTQYWMDVATQNQIIPGMSSGEMSGMGGFMGMPSGPKRSLLLRLSSPQQLPKDPNATHDIPPGQKMGETLPLLIPPQEKARPEKHEERKEAPHEKPKARMLIYWGCSETVGKGQPRVLDTEKMSLIEFGKAMATGRAPSPQYPPHPRPGWIYAEWPNKKSGKEVPKDSSLQGGQFVHGNYAPDIKFSIDRTHDFMAPVEFTSMKGGLAESVKFQWKSIPAATGYFAMAIASVEKTGEMIIWTSSEVQETGFGLMDYLSESDVQKFIREKVVMDPDTASCNIPKGIFKDAGGGMLQFIAYGDEMNVVYPPKPKDPKQPWNPIWSVKLRNKSTGMAPLGMEGNEEERRPSRRSRETVEEPSERQPEEKQAEQPQEEEGTLKKLRKGFFGF